MGRVPRSWPCPGEAPLSGEAACLQALKSWRSIHWGVFTWSEIGREYGDCEPGVVVSYPDLRGLIRFFVYLELAEGFHS